MKLNPFSPAFRKTVLFLGIVAAVLMMLRPPWVHHGLLFSARNLGYAFLSSPPPDPGTKGSVDIDWPRLIVQWTVVAIIVLGVFLAGTDVKRRLREQPWTQKIVILIGVLIAVLALMFPPWKWHSPPYYDIVLWHRFLFSPPRTGFSHGHPEIDWFRLIVRLDAIVLLTSGCLYAIRNRRRSRLSSCEDHLQKDNPMQRPSNQQKEWK